MGKHETPTLPLYERDFFAWSKEQAAKLRGRAHNEVDWENVAEEIESLGRRDRREIRSRLGVLIGHLLKWEHQPEHRSHGWQSTIGEQRLWIENIISDSPSLRRYPNQIAETAYRDGVRIAVRDTGIKGASFPKTMDFTMKQVLDERFWPGEPFSPGDILHD